MVITKALIRCRPAIVRSFHSADVGSQRFFLRALSTKPQDDLTSLQRVCWDSYLSSGQGTDTLFHSIDANHTQKLSKQEIQMFLRSVKRQGVHPRAFEMIQEIAEDHQLTLDEFTSWLVLARKFGMNEDRRSLTTTVGASAATLEDFEDDIDYSSDEYEKEEEAAHTWNELSMNQAVRNMQYAVRGDVVNRADELQAEGKQILFTNIGNPQAVGQSPITYYRQVIALCDLPAEAGVDHPEAIKMFPSDVILRAKAMRKAIGPAGTGAYSGSQGILQFRQDVADFISSRDGHQSDPANIFLTNGASSAIELVLATLIGTANDGVMIPIPQYPIYSALITKLGGQQIGYELDESKNWAATEDELQRRLEESKTNGHTAKALAIINPGNPTGQVFSRSDLEVICKFCADNGIVLLADEVYQRNVYTPVKEFLSAKKVAMETPGCEHLQLVSFHSTSKGTIGECGRRGGYMELHNIDPYVQSQLYKLASSGLCSNIPGQVMTSLMVRPPKEGEESFSKFVDEEGGIFEGMKRRAKALVHGLNQVDGIECNSAEGSMYAFPNVKIPPKAIERAEELGMSPDTMYSLSLLEETGICVVPASGFGQKEGRAGFRTTFLPSDEKMMAAIDQFASHHRNFCAKFD